MYRKHSTQGQGALLFRCPAIFNFFAGPSIDKKTCWRGNSSVVDWFLIEGPLEDERDRLAALLGHLPACGCRMALKDRALGQVNS